MARKRPDYWHLDIDEPEPEEAPAEPCWLCERPLGETVEYHHPVPKSRKGRGTVAVHPICHRTVHASFDNKELERIGFDRDRIVNDDRFSGFMSWIADKPPDFHTSTRTTNAKRGRQADRNRRKG